MSIKESIKPFVPPSARIVRGYTDMLSAKGDALISLSSQITSKIDGANAELGQITGTVNNVNNVLGMVAGRVNLYPVPSYHPLLYNWDGQQCFEYDYLAANGFFEAIHRDDYRKRYFALVKGLDEKSIATINQVLARVTMLEGHRNDPLDIYTDDEKRNIAWLEREYFPYILKLDENCYAYRQYRLPINHFEACVFIDKHGIDLLRAPLSTLADKDIIDAGGFVGDSILILSPLTNKKVYSFEAVTENYEHMLETMKLNDIKNAVCEHCALGDKPGTAEFNINDSSSNQNILPQFKHERVPVITLDDYVREHHLNVGLIKDDLEGAEQSFLAGARETITSQRPVLLFSIYHNDSDFFEIKQIIDSWNLGYKFRVHRGMDYGVCLETMLIAEVV